MTNNNFSSASGKTPVIGHSGGFRKTLSFGLTCLVYYATDLFCRRNFDLKNDPLGKTYGQMLGAARSAKQNIVEGSSRAGTSRETELRLYDVAKGSLEELAGDYEDFLFSRGELPWSERDPRWIRAAGTPRRDGLPRHGSAEVPKVRWPHAQANGPERRKRRESLLELHGLSQLRRNAEMGMEMTHGKGL